MKKIIYILLLALVLTGCGKADKMVQSERENDVKEKVVREEEAGDKNQETSEDTTQTEERVQTETASGMDNEKGQEVVQIGEENGWSKIEFDGTVGYVNSKYLSAEKVDASSSTNTGNNNTTTNQNMAPSLPVHEHTWEEITEEKKVSVLPKKVLARVG